MDPENEKIEFAKKIDEWTIAAISAGAQTFEELLQSLPSVYPTALQAAIRRLADGRKLSPETADYLAQPSIMNTTRRVICSFLPPPHPLNYEWRFTPEGSDQLLDIALDLSAPGEQILMIGTPTVAVQALSRPPNRRLMFLGEDNPVTRRIVALRDALQCDLAVTNCNIAGPAIGSAKVVLLDPPWYLDFVRSMLATAAAACCEGGYVVASLPPKGVRGSAERDRETTLQIAHRYGLAYVSTVDQPVTYETPFFEANALRAVGLVVPQAWRTGDVVVFKKIGSFKREIFTATVRKERWTEVSVGRMRLFVGRNKSSLANSALGQIIPGDILPSVSRKDQRRGQANVWTSGNRIFTSGAPETLIAAAIAINGERYGGQQQLCSSAQEREELERVGCLLGELAVIEATEERGLTTPKNLAGTNWNSISIPSDTELRAVRSG